MQMGKNSRLIAVHHAKQAKPQALYGFLCLRCHKTIAKHQVAAVAFDVSKTI